MKYWFVLILCFFVGSNALTAQNFGFTIGMNRSQIRWNDSSETRRIVAPIIGFNYQKSYVHWGWQTGIQSSFRGGNDLDSSVNYRSLRADFRAIAYVPLNPDVRLFAGAMYSNALSQIRSAVGDTLGPNYNYHSAALTSRLEPIVGVSILFSPKTELQLQYSFLEQKPGYTNFNLQLHFRPQFGSTKVNLEKITQLEKSQIEQLKTGYLLVRLPVMNNQLNYLKEKGNQADIDTFLNRRARTHDLIRKAFTDSFQFCKVLFFNGSYNQSIYNNELSNVLEDSNGKIIKSLIQIPFYLVADFGSIEADSSYNPRKNNYEYQGVLEGKLGMMIRDSHGVQLKDPFPFYVLRIYQSQGKALGSALTNEKTSLWIGDDWNYNAMAKKLEYRLKNKL